MNLVNNHVKNVTKLTMVTVKLVLMVTIYMKVSVPPNVWKDSGKTTTKVSVLLVTMLVELVMLMDLTETVTLVNHQTSYSTDIVDQLAQKNTIPLNLQTDSVWNVMIPVLPVCLLTVVKPVIPVSSNMNVNVLPHVH